MSVPQNNIKILKANLVTKVLKLQKCYFCDSGITTTHVCVLPGRNRKLNEDGDMIFGLATSVVCKDRNENRSRCKKYQDSNQLYCSPCDDELDNKDLPDNPSTSTVPFTPDY